MANPEILVEGFTNIFLMVTFDSSTLSWVQENHQYAGQKSNKTFRKMAYSQNQFNHCFIGGEIWIVVSDFMYWILPVLSNNFECTFVLENH